MRCLSPAESAGVCLRACNKTFPESHAPEIRCSPVYFLFADHLQITSVNTTPFIAESTLVLQRAPEAQRGPRRFQRRVRSALPLDRSPHARVPRLAGDVPPPSRR